MNTDQPIANPERGEAMILVDGQRVVLRPSFTALVAAEGELGPLFALVERAGEVRLSLQDIATLFWHCRTQAPALSREQMGEAVLGAGLAAAAKPLRSLLQQILQGQG